MSEDAKDLIVLATRRFIEEVPALAQLKLVVGVELRGRGDVQLFRLQMPELKEGKVPDWIEAFTYGQAKASGPQQFLRLIQKVVEEHEERQHLKRARSKP